MRRRSKNSPTIREVIRQFLTTRNQPADLDEIYRFVVGRVTLRTKTPRASVFSVITRMPEVVRTQPGMYLLTRLPGTRDE